MANTKSRSASRATATNTSKVSANPAKSKSSSTAIASSVDPVAEMVGLVRAFRALEANLEAMRLQDGALGRALESAARPVR